MKREVKWEKQRGDRRDESEFISRQGKKEFLRMNVRSMRHYSVVSLFADYNELLVCFGYCNSWVVILS